MPAFPGAGPASKTPNGNAPFQPFFPAVVTALGEAADGDAPNSAFVDELRTRLSQRRVSVFASPVRVEACAHLGAALETARRLPGSAGRLGDVIAELVPALAWTRRQTVGLGSDVFARSHGNAMIVGPGGIFKIPGVQLGITVMAPGTVYPEHTHPPDEMYCALSEGEWRQAGGPWGSPGMGRLVRNRPGEVHAMRAGNAPFLALWALLSKRA